MKKILALALALSAAVALADASGYCAAPRKTATAVSSSTATAVPAAKLAGRAQIEVCNSALNGGAGNVGCREDGIDPVMLATGAGDVIAKAACRTYKIGSGTSLKCLSDVNGTVVSATECK